MIPSRQQIQEAGDAKISAPIPVPEWGEDAVLYVRSISNDEHSTWQDRLAARRDKGGKLKTKGAACALLVLAVCDDQGRRVFTDEDAEWLGSKATAPVTRLWDAACIHNQIGDEAKKSLEKNSE